MFARNSACVQAPVLAALEYRRNRPYQENCSVEQSEGGCIKAPGDMCSGQNVGIGVIPYAQRAVTSMAKFESFSCVSRRLGVRLFTMSKKQIQKPRALLAWEVNFRLNQFDTLGLVIFRF